jgi:hypothetical protein
MNLETLKSELVNVKEIMSQTERVYNQLKGQEILLTNLIAKEEKDIKKE